MAIIIITNPAQAGGGAGDPDDGIAIGSIVMWYGSGSAVPAGYSICNGTGGTPNLLGKFIMGASSDSDLLETGGATSHTHTAGTIGNDSSHSHSVSVTLQASTGSVGVNSYEASQADASNGHTHSFSSSFTGSDHNHSASGDSSSSSNIPVYMRLYYIMRVS